MKGTLYVVSAPSGTGKTSLVKKLVETTDNLVVSISHTTRTQRSQEVDGVNYFFVDAQQFNDLVLTGCFLEHAQIYGNYYGTSQAWVEKQLELGKDVILEIDWQGAAQIRRLIPDSIGIYILPPSKALLESRLVSRNQDDMTGISGRLSHVREEVSHCCEYEYVVINDIFDHALADMQAIIRAKRLSSLQQLKLYEQLLSNLMA